MENTQVDHKIPRILGGSVRVLQNTLNKVENLQLLHKQCHKVKTASERKDLISLYRKIRKGLDNTPLKEMSTDRLEQVTYETLIRLYENHRLQDSLKLKSDDTRRLERLYQIARKQSDKRFNAVSLPIARKKPEVKQSRLRKKTQKTPEPRTSET